MSQSIMALLLLANLLHITAAAVAATCPGYHIIDQGIADKTRALGSKILPSETACCALCNATAHCSAWTYHPAAEPAMPRTCWLMPDGPLAPHGAPGSVVSGVPVPPPPPPVPPPPPPIGPPNRQPALGFRPHVVFVLTDDQDLTLDSMSAMPLTQARYGLGPRPNCAGALCFNLSRAYVGTPICCPSRASYLTGKYTHNHRTYQNSAGHGCASPSWTAVDEPLGYPAYLQASTRAVLEQH